MKILADENIERAIVHFLRGEGHDVLYVPESFASTPDPEILTRANGEGRIILTSDLDFGELVFHQKMNAAGIILLRLRTKTLSEKVALFQTHWPAASQQVMGHFVVLSRQRLRVRPLT